MMKTLLDYATDEEATAYRDLVAAKNAAKADVARIRARWQETANAAETRHYAEQNFLRLSAQKAVGYDVSPEPLTGLTAEQLEGQAAELARMLKDAEENERLRTCDVRREAVALLRLCADRCAEDYAQVAKTLGWCWAQLAAVDLPLGQKMGLGHWGRMFVPGAPCFPAMTQYRGQYEMPVVVSGERLQRELERLPSVIHAAAVEKFGELPL
jgi:hypothetical protein